MRSQGEIDNAIADAEHGGVSKWPGMTYEEGVSAALRWVSGDTDEHPMEDGE